MESIFPDVVPGQVGGSKRGPEPERLKIDDPEEALQKLLDTPPPEPENPKPEQPSDND